MKYHLKIVWRLGHSPWDQGPTHEMFLENEAKKEELKQQGTLSSDVYFKPVTEKTNKIVTLEFTDRTVAENYATWLTELADKYNKYLIQTDITEI